MPVEYDLVIRGGLIVDGSGGEPFEADVGILGDKIISVGQLSGAGAEEINARGKLVTPGFVDIHTHYDGQITWENRLVPSSDHGITTVVMGNCGVGFAPCRAEEHELVIRLMEGVEDIPDVVMEAGVPWNWETFPQYLDALDKRVSDIDFAAQLPHSPLRVYVMGKRGADLEPPTAEDLAMMRKLTAEAVSKGALGVSTSRNMAHRFRNGALAPSVSTEETEILALASGLKDVGAGVFQMVPDTNLPPEVQFDLLRRVAAVSERPVSFTFTQTPGQPGGWRTILAELEAAAKEGLTIRGQVIPRPTGAMLGLELSLHPFALNPSFRPIAHLPLAEKVRVMHDPLFRARLISEQPEDPHEFFRYVVGDKSQLYVLGDPPNYNPAPEDSIAARAGYLGVEPLELIYDVLLEKDGKEILYRPMGNAEGERFESAGRNLLRSDHVVLGLGDGGAHYSMICDAAYSTYFLTYWVRDAPLDRRIELPLAIKMLANDPAVAVGLCDRGRIAPGYKADINVIDFARLHLHAPSAAYDLPAGGRRLSQKGQGYEFTIVSGQVTYREGKPSGKLPGRLVRWARAAPCQ